jgi:hypothetical protein
MSISVKFNAATGLVEKKSLNSDIDFSDVSGKYKGIFSGSITNTSDGSSYIAAGKNIAISTASNGQVIINSRTGIQFIFDQTAVNASGNLFNNWDALYAEISALPAGISPRIIFTNSYTIPATNMPASGWHMKNAILESNNLATGFVTLTIPDGVGFNQLTGIHNGLTIIAAPTTTHGSVFKWTDYGSNTSPWIFTIGQGASIQNNGSKALILSPGISGQQTYVVIATFGASLSPVIGIPALSAPIAKMQGEDVLIGSQLLCGGFGQLSDNWAETSSATCTLLYQNGIDSSYPTITWAGTIQEVIGGCDSLNLNYRNGLLINRPILNSSRIGQTYFATDLTANGKPLWWNGTTWVDATGTIVP